VAKKRRLPHCDELFLKFIAPRYSDQDRKRRACKSTRGDMEQILKPNLTAEMASPLYPEVQKEVMEQIRTMIEAACEDWSRLLGRKITPTIEAIEMIDEYYDREKIHALIDATDPDESSNDYLVSCIEFGVMVGEVLRSRSGDLVWAADWPYWESFVYDPKTGYRINVFHWAVKKFSEYGWDDGFAEKIDVCIEMLKKEATGELKPGSGEGSGRV
jgi:hypothetical protein